MSDAYVECMVARKPSAILNFLKVLLIIITVIFALIGFGTTLRLMLFPAILTGVGAYFLSIYSDVEFEYLYLDKEITVDKVYNKQKRKRVAVYPMDKIEIMAPLNSWHLDSYKNRTFKEVDYSSQIVKQPEARYVFYYNGEQKVIFEPNAEFMKMARNAGPRKVFVD
ncbi:MAG: hypothetical protein MJ107_06345 [Lachnospiraceae bacterium]|nr:hypothetical protein [Lachnospiraceae bacterium]